MSKKDRAQNRKRRRAGYLAKVIRKADEAMASGTMKPGLYTVTVRHDGWCRLLANRGPCNCNPDVQAPTPTFPPEPKGGVP